MYPPAEHTTTETFFSIFTTQLTLITRTIPNIQISTSAPRLFSQGKQVVDNTVGLKMEKADRKGVSYAGHLV